MKHQAVRFNEEPPDGCAGQEQQQRGSGDAKNLSPSPARIHLLAYGQGTKNLTQEQQQTNQKSGDGDEEQADHAGKDSGSREVFAPTLINQFRNVLAND